MFASKGSTAAATCIKDARSGDICVEDGGGGDISFKDAGGAAVDAATDADDASELTIVDTVNANDAGDVNADGAANVTGW